MKDAARASGEDLGAPPRPGHAAFEGDSLTAETDGRLADCSARLDLHERARGS